MTYVFITFAEGEDCLFASLSARLLTNYILMVIRITICIHGSWIQMTILIWEFLKDFSVNYFEGGAWLKGQL